MKEIKLRPSEVKDAERFYKILTNPNFIHMDIEAPKSLEEEIKFLEGAPERRELNVEWGYTIVFEENVVGAIGVTIDQKRPYKGELGFFIDEKYWKKGIATEAIKLFEKIAFNELKLERLDMLIMVENEASERVAIKTGYTKEGTLKKALKDAKGKYRDVYLYAKVN